MFPPPSPLLIIAAAVLWGTVGVTAKWLYTLGEVDPAMIGLFRLGLAAPLLGALAFQREGRDMWRLHRRHAKWWALAMTSMGAYQLFIFAAVQRTTVTAAAFLSICTAPIMVAAAEPFILGERASPRVRRAGLLALAGSALVLGLGNPGDLVQRAFLLGNVLALAAAMSWATYAIVARRLVHDYPVTRIIFVTFAGAAILVLPLALPTVDALSLPWQGWIGALYLGAGATALAYYFYVRGLRGLSATTSVFLALAEPGTAAILAALLFHEQLTLAGWLGAAALILGLVDLSRA